MMIGIGFLDKLEIDAAFAFRLRFVLVIRQRTPFPVKDEPTPMTELERGADFRQVPATSGGVDHHFRTRFHRMARGFHVQTQIEIHVGVGAPAHRQITR